MNLREFRRILWLTFILPIVSLLVVSIVLLFQIQAARKAFDAVQRRDRNLNRIGQIQRLIIDQETGLRGYQITRDSAFLTPYNAANAALASKFDEFEKNTFTSPQQITRARELRQAYLQWKTEFAEKQMAAAQQGLGTSNVEENLHGKAMMDNIRSIINQLFATGSAGRDRNVATWQQQVHRTEVYLLVLSLIVGLLIAIYMRSALHRVSVSFQQSLTAIQERASALFESEQKLRTTLESIGDGVIVTDSEGRVEMLNPLASELTGWPLGDARGRAIEEVFHIVNETTREIVENPVAKVKRLNRVVGLANHTVLIRREGSEISIDDSGAPIRDRSGVLTGIVMVFRDVTREKKTQAALMANERLAVAGRLAATIAHEIHNPLDSVSNVLYLLRTGPQTDEERVHLLELADQELSRVTQISRAMLSLYRESRVPVQVDLREMLQSLIALMEHNIQKARVTLTSEFPVAVTVEGYPAELRQVFTNLITNAYEAAGLHGFVRIHLNPAPLSEGAQIEVINSGPSVPATIQDKLFQPFFSTKGEKGTGLGLWVSRGIVSKHGGKIVLQSPLTENTGTRVTVTLPAHFTTSIEQESN